MGYTTVNRHERLRLKSMKLYLQQFPKNSAKLQDIVGLASQVTGVPVAFITLLDKEVQWITVRHGYEVEQMPRATSFCTHTIQQDDFMEVQDALLDDRFANNPLVCMQPAVRYYAGISLKGVDGYNVGTLCLMDICSHVLNEQQFTAIKTLAKQVTNILELNLSIQYLQESVTQIEKRNTALKKIAQVQSHDIREPLTSIMGLMNLIKQEEPEVKQQYFPLLEKAVNRLDEKIRLIVQMSSSAHTVA